MPKTDAQQIKAHLAIARNFYDETKPGMTEFYVLDVEYLQAENQRLRAALEIFADPSAWARQGFSDAIPVKATLIAQAALRALAPEGIPNER